MGESLNSRPMLRGMGKSALRIVIIAAYAVTMLAMGYLHRPLAETEPLRSSTIDLAAYVLPDGALPDLCLTGNQPEGQHHSGMASLCDACLLTSGPGLPVADGKAAPDLARAGVSFAPVDTGVADNQLGHRPSSRGPPLIPTRSV